MKRHFLSLLIIVLLMNCKSNKTDSSGSSGSSTVSSTPVDLAYQKDARKLDPDQAVLTVQPISLDANIVTAQLVKVDKISQGFDAFINEGDTLVLDNSRGRALSEGVICKIIVQQNRTAKLSTESKFLIVSKID